MTTTPRWLEPPAPPNDLERIEGLLAQLASQMSSTPKAAAHVIRALDNDRRERQRERRDPTFRARVSVGRSREIEINVLLKRAGWSLREVIDRKLPLTRLPNDLKPLVRGNKITPLKAMLVNRVKNKLTRADLLERVLAGKLSTRALEDAVRVTPRKSGARSSSRPEHNPALDADLRWLELEISRHLGVKATLSPTGLHLECGSGEGLSSLLEQLGVQL